MVEDEYWNDCSPVQELALARFKSAVIVPDVVTGVEPMVREPDDETPMDVTVPEPPPPPTQVPLTAKHPVVMLNPLFEVDVAWATMLRPLTVVVPNPPRAISIAEVVVVANPSIVVDEM